MKYSRIKANSSTLKLRAPEILQDFLPVWRVVISPQIRLEFATQDFQRCTLAYTVCSDQSQYLTRARHRKSVELETVCGVPVCDLGFKIRRQVDDVDGTERAFLNADTTSNAEPLRYEGNL